MVELGQIFRHREGRWLVVNNSPFPIIDLVGLDRQEPIVLLVPPGTQSELVAQELDLAGVGLFPAVLRSTGQHTIGSVFPFFDLISLDGKPFEPFLITQGRDLEVQGQRVFLLGLGILPTIIEVT